MGEWGSGQGPREPNTGKRLDWSWSVIELNGRKVLKIIIMRMQGKLEEFVLNWPGLLRVRKKKVEKKKVDSIEIFFAQ